MIINLRKYNIIKTKEQKYDEQKYTIAYSKLTRFQKVGFIFIIHIN